MRLTNYRLLRGDRVNLARHAGDLFEKFKK
jgi:hypothetical protein